MANEEAIRKHYQLLNHAEETEIRRFGRDLKPGEHASTHAQSEDEFVTKVLEFVRQNENVGVGINERRHGGRGNADVIRTHLLGLDVDTTNPEEIKTIHDAFEQQHFEPAAIVDSGSKGYHYYFNIAPSDDAKETLEDAKHHFLVTLNLPFDKSCFDPARILRVWGTHNQKTGREVTILNYNPEAPPIEIPPRPDIVKDITFIGENNKTRTQVVARNQFIEDYLANKIKLEVPKEGAEFNAVFVPNVVAYAHKRGIKNLKALYNQIKGWNGYSSNAIDGWIRKAPEINYRYAQIRRNVKNNYPELYEKYFQDEDDTTPSDIRYSVENVPRKKARQHFREGEWFTIHPDTTIKGLVVQIQNNTSRVVIAQKYRKRSQQEEVTLERENQRYLFMWMDERRKLTKEEIEELHVHPTPIPVEALVYKYQVDHQDHPWTVLSEQKLETGRYVLHGAALHLVDKELVGQASNLSTKAQVLFLHSYEALDTAPPESEQELYQLVPFSTDQVMDWLLTQHVDDGLVMYKTTPFMRQTYTIAMFAGRYDGMPLNINIFGSTGTGKTTQLTSIHEKFDESQGIISGTDVTFRGLTVSFYGSTPRVGAFGKAKRLLFIDEFMKMLSRKTDESYDELTSLNKVLDNNQYTPESGKGSVELHPTCQLISGTNPFSERHKQGQRGKGAYMTFDKMVEAMPKDFVGRFLNIIQGWDEEKAVGPHGKESLKTTIALDSEKFCALYDFCCTKKIKGVDWQRVENIIRGINMPEVFEAAYHKSCLRNSRLVFNAIVKARCFDEKAKEWSPKESDYAAFEQYWKDVHVRWVEASDDVSNPMEFLNPAHVELVQKIQALGSMSRHTFEKEGGDTALRKRLQKLKLIRFDNDTIYYANPDEVRL